MRLNQKIASLEFNEKFEQDIDRIRSKFNINPCKSSEVIKQDILTLNQDRNFVKLIHLLCKKYELPEKCFNGVIVYVIDGGCPDQDTSDARIINCNGKYHIEIDEETTFRSARDAFYNIKARSNPSERRNKKYKNFWRDRMIEDLMKFDVPIPDICNAIKEEFHEDLDYGVIKTSESRFRKKFGIQKTNKLRTKNNK